MGLVCKYASNLREKFTLFDIIGVATAKLLVRNGSTHHLSSAIVLQHFVGPAAGAKIRKSPGLRPLFSKAIHDGIFLLTVPFLLCVQLVLFFSIYCFVPIL